MRPGLEAFIHLVLSDGTALARAGGSINLTLSIGALVELCAGFSADQAHGVTRPDGAAETRADARVYPIYAGLRLLGHRGRWSAGGGVRGGLAVIVAEGQRTDDGFGARTVTRQSALVGVEALVRLHLHPAVALSAQAAGDLLVTRVRFDEGAAPDSTPLVDTGRLSLRLGAGLSVTLP